MQLHLLHATIIMPLLSAKSSKFAGRLMPWSCISKVSMRESLELRKPKFVHNFHLFIHSPKYFRYVFS